ncbi:surface-adhesin E family protein [Paraburkholderia sp. RCC_158]|uniref:surface-adhesin E family protein n=1 Tax=Paraburkholderia sp. RCC_158 TaxID=3239220 RepID=UPI003526689C
MIRKGVVCAALLAAATGVHAQSNWVQVADSGDSKVFVDTASIIRSGSTVKVWTDSIYTPPTNDFRTAQPVAEDKARWTFDCAQQMSNAGGFALYGTDRALIYSGPSSSNWKDVIPGSIGDAVMKAVCRQ